MVLKKLPDHFKSPEQNSWCGFSCRAVRKYSAYIRGILKDKISYYIISSIVLKPKLMAVLNYISITPCQKIILPPHQWRGGSNQITNRGIFEWKYLGKICSCVLILFFFAKRFVINCHSHLTKRTKESWKHVTVFPHIPYCT